MSVLFLFGIEFILLLPDAKTAKGHPDATDIAELKECLKSING